MTVAAAVVNVTKIMLLRGERGNLLSAKLQTSVSVRLNIAALAAIKACRASDINFVDAVISCVR